MKNVRLVVRTDPDPAVAAATPPMMDGLSRELALTAAGLPDQRLRLVAAMQILGNMRDFLVADMSGDAEGAIDDAIEALMRCERRLEAAWRR
jgi:hypothetical protein